MSNSVPRIQFNKGQILGPCNVLSPVQDWNIDALLASQPHFRYLDGHWSGGGPLYVWKRKVSHTGNTVTMTRNGVTITATPAGSTGGVQVSPPKIIPMSMFPTFNSATSGMTGNYATGYSRARPGNPVASVGQFLAELRSLPTIPAKGLWKLPISEVPKALFQRLKDFRNLGSEYLNVQFGWVPFVSDLQKMYNLWHDIDKRMAQLVRENNKYIRRRATVEDSVSTTVESRQFTYPYGLVYCQPPSWAVGSTRWQKVVSTKTRIWFVGSFKYYIPDTTSSQWNARARLALFGALPTPELLWEVMPWSWLIDWFSNVGDIVSNASMNAVDNLTLRYSFIMKHVTEKIEVTSQSFHPAVNIVSPTGFVVAKWDANDFTYRSTQVTERKMRLGGGNPFGLNVQFDSLSNYQLSILTALGLSRSAVR